MSDILAGASAPRRHRFHARVLRFAIGAVAVIAAVLVPLVAPTPAQAAPDLHTQVVTDGTDTFTLDLTRVDLRGAEFEVVVQQAGGSYVDQSALAGDERSYLGTVRERPDAYVSATLMNDGTYWAQIVFDTGVTWWTAAGSVVDKRGTTPPSAYVFPSKRVLADGVGSAVYGTDVGFDLANDYWANVGATVPSAMEMVEYGLNNTRAIYLHQIGVLQSLGRVVIRTDQETDPYAPNASQLDELRLLEREWETSHAAAGVDQVVAVFGTNSGGLANTPNYDPASNYSVNGSSVRGGRQGAFDVVVRHEMAHNWGLTDLHAGSPEGPTIESGNQYARWDLSELWAMARSRGIRVADGTLSPTSAAWTATQLPPTGVADLVDGVAGRAPLAIDVLRNDHSANGSPLRVVSAGANGTSVLGQPVSVLADGTVRYTPPAAPSDALDRFTYVVEDANGRTATVSVLIRNGLPYADHEAEQAVRGPGTAVYDWAQNFSGTGSVWTNAPGEYVEYTVDQPEERAVTLQLRYYTDNRSVPARVFVDGVLVGSPSVTTGGQGRYINVDVPATLTAGRHVIRMENAGTPGQEIFMDRLRVISTDARPAITAAGPGIPAARIGEPYSASLATPSVDSDLPADSLTFELLNGPAWLSLAADGTLSGTPPRGADADPSVSVRVTDAFGLTSDGTFDVVFAEGVTPGGPFTVAEGQPLILWATGPGGVTCDLNGDGDFGDATGLTPTVSWQQLVALSIDDGPFTGEIVARVGDDETTEKTATLTVDNAAPAATLDGPSSGTAGASLTLKVGAVDPSPADAAAMFGYVVDWGDGSEPTRTDGPADPPVSHAYAAPGTYTVSATATDRDGATSAAMTVEITIAAASPGSGSGAAPTAAVDGAGDGRLPATGVRLEPALVGAGAILALVGAALAIAARRRRIR